MKRKILVFLLAIAMLVNSTDMALASGRDVNINEQAQNASEIKGATDDKKEIERLFKEKADFENKDVRVIVEFKEESLLDMANKKNVDFKELSEREKEQKKESIKKDQDRFLDKIEGKINKGEKVINYDTALNAVAFSTKGKEIKNIQNLDSVKNVYLSEEFERPTYDSDHELMSLRSEYTNEKYKGEGMLVAVIDSGLDYKHEALSIDEEALYKVKYTEESINAIRADKNLKGIYYTSKVPYGYNYYDNNFNLYDAYGVMHGMHVTGIVAANDKKNKRFGIAPNAQILALKVFSDDIQYPTTFTDIWIKAIDDAIKLKADVINMSLGSAAGLSYEGVATHPENAILKKAKDAGIVVSIAAGNESTITEGFYGQDNVKAIEKIYDTAEIANPALSSDSFAVASLESAQKFIYKISWMDFEARRRGEKSKQEDSLNLAVAKEDYKMDIVSPITDLGKGHDIDDEELGNKIAMVEYPGSEEAKTFNEVLEKIASKKPSAILMYKTKDQTDYLGGRITLTGKAGDLTVGIIKHSTYENIMKAIKPNLPFFVTIETRPSAVENEDKGLISKFSSWGPTPDLRIKPEITAVGGNVYSLSEDQRYKNMSGTSMAAPQIAGYTAVLKQYLLTREDMPEDPEFIKLLLMNTARPVKNKEGNLYFVRQQGAGQVDLDKALNTDLTIKASGTNDSLKDAKLELRQINDKKFSVNLEVKNYSDKEKNIEISYEAIYEKIVNGKRSQSPEKLISNNDRMVRETIKGHETKNISFEIDYTDAKLETENYLEGFIFVRSADESLSVPFLGFYGNWDKQRAIDPFSIPELGKEKEEAQFVVNSSLNVNSSSFITSNGAPLPIIDNKLYFSPENEYFKDVIVRIAPLRNMEVMEFSILDGETKEVLRVLGKAYDVRKLSRLKVNNSFRALVESHWDGKINGNLADSSKDYIYQIKVKLNNREIGGDGLQVYQYPIIIDDSKPNVSKDISFENIANEDERMKKLTFSVTDKQSKIKEISLSSVKYGDNGDAQETLSNIKYGKNVSIEIVDHEINFLTKEKLLKIENGNEIKIPIDKVSKNPDESSVIQVYRNKSTAETLKVELPFFIDRTHIRINAKDNMNNSENTIVKTGFKTSYNSVNFMNYLDHIEKNARLFVDGKEVKSPIYSTLEKTARVKIVFNKEGKFLSTLKTKQGKNIEEVLTQGSVNGRFADKYQVVFNKEERSVEFTISNLGAKLDVYTFIGDGQIQDNVENKKVTIRFNKEDLDNFSQVKVFNDKVEFADGKTNLSTNTGTSYLEMVFDKEKIGDRKINKITVIEDGGEKILKRTGFSFDVQSGKLKDFYSISPYSLQLSLDLKKDIEIRFEYGDDYEEIYVPIIDDHDHHSDDDVELITTDNNSIKKYPAVFLESVRLLDVLTNVNTRDDQVHLKGFVGYVNPDDEVELVIISLLDNDGNLKERPLILPKEYLVEDDHIKYSSGTNNLYNGHGYRFETMLDIKDYNTNIQIKAVTKKNLEGSIERRILFDKIAPDLSYEVVDRNLADETVTIKVYAKDNSHRLKLMHNDSVIENVDKTVYTFEDPGVQIEKEYTFKLKEGQNEIKLIASDLANYTTTRSIYIFRTFEMEKDEMVIEAAPNLVENKEIQRDPSVEDLKGEQDKVLEDLVDKGEPEDKVQEEGTSSEGE